MSSLGRSCPTNALHEAVQGDLFELWQQPLATAQSASSEHPPPPAERTGVGKAPTDSGASVALVSRAPLVFQRSARARHYRLTLRRDGTALVTIPARGSQRAAEQFAAQHAQWLERARQRQAQRPQSARIWELGTTVLWRGVFQEIRAASAAELGAAKWRAQVSLGGELFRVARLSGDLKPTLEAQFARLARTELPLRTRELASRAQQILRSTAHEAFPADTARTVPLARVVVRDQRSRWGSCSGRGTLSLNWRLVQTPDFVRDYIIYHELMHLREMNHSARFWARVAEVCPDWERAEYWLKQNGSLLLGE